MVYMYTENEKASDSDTNLKNRDFFPLNRNT